MVRCVRCIHTQIWWSQSLVMQIISGLKGGCILQVVTGLFMVFSTAQNTGITLMIIPLLGFFALHSLVRAHVIFLQDVHWICPFFISHIIGTSHCINCLTFGLGPKSPRPLCCITILPVRNHLWLVRCIPSGNLRNQVWWWRILPSFMAIFPYISCCSLSFRLSCASNFPFLLLCDISSWASRVFFRGYLCITRSWTSTTTSGHRFFFICLPC